MKIKTSILNIFCLSLFLIFIGVIFYFFRLYFYILPQLRKQIDNVLYNNKLSQIINYEDINYYPLINIIKISNINGPFFNIKNLIYSNKEGVSLTLEGFNLNILDISRERLIKAKKLENLDLNDIATELVILGFNSLKGNLDLTIKGNKINKNIWEAAVKIDDFGDLSLQGELSSNLEGADAIKTLTEGTLRALVNLINKNISLLSQTKLDTLNLRNILLTYKDMGFVVQLKQFNAAEKINVPSVEATEENGIRVEKEISRFLSEYRINGYFTQKQINNLRNFWLNGGNLYFNIGGKEEVNLGFLLNNLSNKKVLFPYFYQSGANFNCEPEPNIKE